MSARRSLCVGVGGLLLLVLPTATAFAALWLELDPKKGSPGTIVRGETIGSQAFPEARPTAFPLLLQPTSGEDRQAAPLGTLRVDGKGVGRTRFRIPQAAPGSYRLILECQPCAAYSAGRTRIPVAMIEVLHDEGGSTAGSAKWIWIIGVTALTSMVSVSVIHLLRKRHGRRLPLAEA